MDKTYVEQRDGDYWITGTRISLESIIAAFNRGAAPETIRRSFPLLTMEEVYGAITFYLAHENDFDEHLKQSDAEIVLDAPKQAESDEHLISLWLHGRPGHTIRAYSSDVRRFLNFVGKDLRLATLGDLQSFDNSLSQLSEASRARKLSSVKSLLAFAHRLGYLPFDVGAAVSLPKVRNRLAERILTEAQVITMISLEKDPRNHAILLTLYLCGLRVSELTSLTWRDLTERAEAGQLTVMGKGGKTRTVLLPQSLWEELLALRVPAVEGENETARNEEPVFHPGYCRQRLSEMSIWRVVRQAAARAGIPGNVSPDWMRHASKRFVPFTLAHTHPTDLKGSKRELYERGLGSREEGRTPQR